MIVTACLAVLLALAIVAKTLEATLRALDVAPAEALLYLGLAERDVRH